MECALSFEGEYDRTQETKIETNAEFQQIKQLANDVVVDESCKLVDQEESDSLKEELLEYIKKRFESAAEELKEQIKAECHYVIEPNLTYTCFADAARNNSFNP